MVRGRCVVQGCNRKSTTDKDNPVKLFRIPIVRKYDADITFRRRVLWLKRLNLSDENIPSGGVCDVHFIAGKPSHYIEETNPDWAPTQNIGSKNLVAKSALDRYNRIKKFQSVKTYRIESLTKGNSKRVVVHPSTASSSRGISSIDKKDLPSVEVAVKKITHPMPGVFKKPEEMTKIVNKNQFDIFCMHQLPVKNASQVCYGKVIELGETNNPNRTQSLNMKGFVNRIEYKKGGVGTKQDDGEGYRRPMVILPISTLQQVMRDPCEESSLFVSDSRINDHNYCAKPTVEKEQHHVYLDHDYCQSFQSYEPSFPIPENISESSILRQTETRIHNQSELISKEIRENPYEVAIHQNELHSTCEIDSVCDFILPDSEQCSTCDELSSLKSDLEKKSLVLEIRRKDVNSLKQELALAKEQISNLRAQLEENTRTLWSCLSMNGKSS